jgi:DUF1680 family protein
LPHLFAELERAGNIPNLRLAADGKREGYQGPVYMDSDLYKALEAAAYVLQQHPDDPIRATVDEVIGVLERAQQPDGYLNSYFQVVAPDKRWSNLRDWHELYCAGHLIEAAVAHYHATGSERLLPLPDASRTTSTRSSATRLVNGSATAGIPKSNSRCFGCTVRQANRATSGLPSFSC